ncbi:hypothetical protein BS47DRAFT_1319393 [Hydnum rufescens UP504]|uniref:ENTH domain-containing protein n=1 Tax=Hydnum rufescens UP504 TaxID=1448309 RepID=A0A9P6ASH5_9AGAM|nr:hypothetical protein BS47DRAFT_1319393 [Hydnum rufescens UP504]
MSTLQSFGKGALRVAKNYTKGYSEVQAKVRDATSNDPWGPSGTQMNELAQLTYNQNDFVEIMEMLDKRLNDKGKNWRHVFKALTVLDYCLHAGSENVIIYFKDNIYIIKTLKEFQYLDEDQKDQGANVRQKAKDITNLLQDDARLRQERKSRAYMHDRLANGTGGADDYGKDSGDDRFGRSQSVPPGAIQERPPRDDEDMRRAIEESKRSLQAEQDKQNRLTKEERDLQAALRLSQDEEAARNRALEDANSRALFDDQNQMISLADTPLQPQHTSIQPQFTSFNPYAQQMQQQAMQEEYLRQQAEWNLMQQQQQQLQQQQLQQEEWARQQAALEQQALQQQAALQQQQQEEWLRQQAAYQQQLQQQQQQQIYQPQLQAQVTSFGSNNPFTFNPQPSAQSPPPMPNFSASTPNLSVNTFTPRPTSEPSPTEANTRANARRPYVDDGRNAQLASIIGNREDGLDTFGNIGQLRYGHTGAQTAPLVGQRTGTGVNPFASFTQQQRQPNEQPFFSI